jgi:rhodanese-related sulfurtransferase
MNFNAGVLRALMTAVLVTVLNGAASAEVVKGTVKSIAKESKVFTLLTPDDSVSFIVWDNNTTWNGINKPAGIYPGEAITVDIRQNQLAASISKIKADMPAGVTAMPMDEVAEGLKARTLAIIDTRPVDLFDRAHIPGAISVPLSRLEKRSFRQLPENKTAKLVFYDEGQGGVSAQGAELAVKAGYKNVSVLLEGVAGWYGSGRILASSAAFLRKSRPVIIDLRSPEAVSQGHIEGAVNFPASALPEKKQHFPMGKWVPIVLYGGSDEDAAAAAGTIRKWGYRNITIFPGGAEAWHNNAEVLRTGPAAPFIDDTGSHGGFLDPNGFEKALASRQIIEIIDARTAAEQEKGSFPQTIKIPLQDMPRRLGELNKEMIQVVVGSNPEYAEMAFDFLKAKGYRVNYLNGTVEFGKDGKYTVK